MSRIKKGFSGLSVPDQVTRAINIHGAMTGNANFPTPSPTLVEFLAAITALNTAWNESRNRDRLKIEIMKLRRADMLALVTQMAAYVQSTSDGDADIILSSGFDIIARGLPKPPVGQVLNVRVANGTVPASLKLQWDREPQARVYVVEVSTDPFTEDTFKPKGVSTKTRIQIGGLEPSTKYWLRVAAIGKDGIGLWSQPVWDIAK